MPEPLASAVDHVAFRVEALEEARHFYVDLLGCVEIHRPPLPNPGAWLLLGDVQVHLVVVPPDIDPGRAPGEPTGFANHVAFRTSDCEAAARRLRQAGYDVRDSPVGFPQLFVQDPSGNVIELFQR